MLEFLRCTSAYVKSLFATRVFVASNVRTTLKSFLLFGRELLEWLVKVLHDDNVRVVEIERTRGERAYS